MDIFSLLLISQLITIFFTFFTIRLVYIFAVVELDNVKKNIELENREYTHIERLLEIYAVLVIGLTFIDILNNIYKSGSLYNGINAIIISIVLNALYLRFIRYRNNKVYKPKVMQMVLKHLEMFYIGCELLRIRFNTTRMK